MKIDYAASIRPQPISSSCEASLQEEQMKQSKRKQRKIPLTPSETENEQEQQFARWGAWTADNSFRYNDDEKGWSSPVCYLDAFDRGRRRFISNLDQLSLSKEAGDEVTAFVYFADYIVQSLAELPNASDTGEESRSKLRRTVVDLQVEKANLEDEVVHLRADLAAQVAVSTRYRAMADTIAVDYITETTVLFDQREFLLRVIDEIKSLYGGEDLLWDALRSIPKGKEILTDINTDAANQKQRAKEIEERKKALRDAGNNTNGIEYA